MGSYMKHFIAALSVVILTACGGGGGGSTPTNQTDLLNQTSPDITFRLFPSEFLTEGYSESYTLTGSDTEGGTQTGTFNIETRAQTTYLNAPAIPTDGTLNITNTETGAFIASVGAEYYSIDLNDLHYLGFSSTTFGTVTASATTTAIPLTAKIGEFGTVGTYIDSAGDKEVISWQLIDGGNGKAKFVSTNTEFDQFDTLALTTETSYLIDENGNRYSVEFRAFYYDINVTLTLSGNKN